MFEGRHHFVQDVSLGVVNLHDDLADPSPVVVGDAAQHIQFALLGIEFDQIDDLQSVLGDNFGKRHEWTFHFLLVEPPLEELLCIFASLIRIEIEFTEHILDHGHDRLRSLPTHRSESPRTPRIPVEREDGLPPCRKHHN